MPHDGTFFEIESLYMYFKKKKKKIELKSLLLPRRRGGRGDKQNSDRGIDIILSLNVLYDEVAYSGGPRGCGSYQAGRCVC
jgi:hypothetical protein